jgi:hypothetical protein
LVCGRAVTGVLHFVNGTPIEWYSERQATYGAEFYAARVTADQIVYLRLTLRYLSVPIDENSHIFGDNASVVISASILHSSKRHNALSFHCVREAIAFGIMYLHIIGTKLNSSDILSKHTGFVNAWPILCPLMFWKGLDDGIGSRNPSLRTNGEYEDMLNFRVCSQVVNHPNYAIYPFPCWII